MARGDLRVSRRVLGLAVAAVASLPALSCNTSGLKSVYMAPDEGGTIDRLQFIAGTAVYCIADVAIGDPKATLKISMQPVILNGAPTRLPPLVVGERIPGRFSGKVATEFPKISIQAIPDPRDPQAFTTTQSTQAPGRYRCIVELDDELDFTDFEILPGSAPTNDANAPAPGECKNETVAKCPLSGGGAGTVRCCTAQGACGTGPQGTGFCYPSL